MPTHDPTPASANDFPERLSLVECQETSLVFDSAVFVLQACDDRVRITDGHQGEAILEKKNQQVPYKAVILGSVVLAEEITAPIDYARYFTIDWSDELAPPEVIFARSPTEIGRHYAKGGRIELGIENVGGYHILYADGVEADFDRTGDRAFGFAFNTGFYGSFEEIGDGAYTLTFKGDRLDPEEDELRSQSKFVISRSKYSGNLVLVLQEDAKVLLKGRDAKASS